MSADQFVAKALESSQDIQAKQAAQIAELQEALDAANFVIEFQAAELQAYRRDDEAAAAFEAQLEAASRQPVAMNWALGNLVTFTVDGAPLRVVVNTQGRQTTRVTTHHSNGTAAITEEKTTATAVVQCDLPVLGTLEGKCKIVSTAVNTGSLVNVTNRLEIDIPLRDWRNRHISVYASARVSTDGQTVKVEPLYAPHATVDAKVKPFTSLAIE